MSDTSYLDWPFLEDRHRALKAGLEDWCGKQSFRHDDDIDDICRGLVADLGEAGILRNCVPAASGGVFEPGEEEDPSIASVLLASLGHDERLVRVIRLLPPDAPSCD